MAIGNGSLLVRVNDLNFIFVLTWVIALDANMERQLFQYRSVNVGLKNMPLLNEV